MIACKMTTCPYQQKGCCVRRAVVINELGLCSFLYRGQQQRQNVSMEGLIKNEAAVFDAKISQINSEDLVSQDAAMEVKENE